MRADAKLKNNLEKTGWEVITVFGDEQGPAFAFTLGLFHSFKHPEILVMGLPIPAMQDLLHGIGANVKKGVIYADGEEYTGVIPRLTLAFRQIHPENYQAFLGTAIGAYGTETFPALQCFWPDPKGAFSWHDGFDERYRRSQQMLFEQLAP